MPRLLGHHVFQIALCLLLLLMTLQVFHRQFESRLVERQASRDLVKTAP